MGKLLNETATAAPETAAVMPAMPPRRLRRRAAPTPLDAVIDPCSIFAAKKAMHFDPTDIYSVMPQPTSAKAAEVLAEQRRKRRLSITEGQGLPPIVLGDNVPRTFVNFGAAGPEAASPLRAPVVLRGTNWFAPDCQKETLLPTPREHITQPTTEPVPATKPQVAEHIDDGAAVANQDSQPQPPLLQVHHERQLEAPAAGGEPPRAMPSAARQQPPRSPLRQGRKAPPPAPKRHGSFKEKVKAFFKTGACHADTTRDKHAHQQRYIPREPSLLVRRDANTQPLVVAAPTTALMRSASQIERRSAAADEQQHPRRAMSVDYNRQQQVNPVRSRGGTESLNASMSATYPSRAGPGSIDTELKRNASFSDKVKDFMRGPTSDTPRKPTSAANTPRKKSASSESFTPKRKPAVKPFDPAESFGSMRNPLLPPNPARNPPQDVGAAVHQGASQATAGISPKPEQSQPTVRFADSPKQPDGNRGLDEFKRPREASPPTEPVRQPLANDDIAAFNGGETEAVPQPPETTESPIQGRFGLGTADLARPYHTAEKRQYHDIALRREHMAG